MISGNSVLIELCSLASVAVAGIECESDVTGAEVGTFVESDIGTGVSVPDVAKICIDKEQEIRKNTPIIKSLFER